MKKMILALSVFMLAACQSVNKPVATITLPETLIPTEVPITATPVSTQTPQPAATSETVKISSMDGMTQIFIPTGTVYMGGLDVLRDSDEIPAHKVMINAYWIDQVEVTNGMYNLCVEAGDCRPPVKNSSDNRLDYFGNPEFRDYPVVHVSWMDANLYCQWAERRLPTEAEWERAARGDDMRTYPWGDEPPNANITNSENSVGDTSRVGSYADGASPFGALDMAGNVWEWVADYYKPTYYEVSPSTNPVGPENTSGTNFRVIRGGAFQDTHLNLRLSNRGYEVGPDPFALPPNETYYGHSSAKIGFRCADAH